MQKQLIIFLWIFILIANSDIYGVTYVNGNITSDTTWTLSGSPYIFNGDVSVKGVTLAIEAGVVVNFQSSHLNIVSRDVYGNFSSGRLIADNVLFNATGLFNNYIVFQGDSFNNINYYAGGSLTNCTFENVYLDMWNYTDPTISNNSFTYVGNSGTAIKMHGVSTPIITNNTISGYEYPFSISYGALPTISGNNVSGCVYQGIGLSGIFTNDYTLPDYGYPYKLVNGLFVAKSIFTITSGLNVELGNHGIYIVTVYNGVGAANLIANNVHFTGNTSNLNAYIQFDGVRYNNVNYYAGGSLTNCTFENVYLDLKDYTDPTISNNSFTYVGNSGTAIKINYGGNADIQSNYFAGYGNAIEVLNTTYPINITIAYNNFDKNLTFGVKNNDASLVIAQNNYWGDPTGPYEPNQNPNGLGCGVQNAIFSPWLTSPTVSYALTTDPRLLDFEMVNVADSLIKSVKFKNIGNIDVIVNNLQLSGGYFFEYDLLNIQTPFTIAPNDSEIIDIIFHPTSAGLKDAYIKIYISGQSIPDTVFLSGYGLPSNITQVTDGALILNNSDYIFSWPKNLQTSFYKLVFEFSDSTSSKVPSGFINNTDTLIVNENFYIASSNFLDNFVPAKYYWKVLTDNNLVISSKKSFMKINLIPPNNTNNQPIVLVHGWLSDGAIWTGGQSWFGLKGELENLGYSPWVFEYPNTGLIEQSAWALSHTIKEVLASSSGYSKVNILAHSMGGLVTRAYIQDFAEDLKKQPDVYDDDVKYVAFLATPHHGGRFAYIGGLLSSALNTDFLGGKQYAVWQLDPQSSFINNINSIDLPISIKYLAIGGYNNNIFHYLASSGFSTEDSNQKLKILSSIITSQGVSDVMVLLGSAIRGPNDYFNQYKVIFRNHSNIYKNEFLETVRFFV